MVIDKSTDNKKINNKEKGAKEKFKRELEELLELTCKNDATDLHIVPGSPPVLRVDSQLVRVGKRTTLDVEHAKELALALLTPEQEVKFWREKDMDFSFSYKSKARFRANVYQQMGKVCAAFRFLPVKVRTIEELNLPSTLHDFTRAAQGFFLVVGPSGHGKSTALAAMIDEINHSRYDHIVTIEDPIEYIFIPDKCIIGQRELGVDVKDFPRGLRAMFREDTDVVFIGEMRDAETMAAAVTAAETGHLIFSTLHTGTAAQTIDRIIDSFPPHQHDQIRTQLAGTLLGILSRRLIPRVKGGLINAVELLIVNSAVRNLIREKKVHQIDMVIDTSIDEGMISLNRSLADLVVKGEISLENAERCSPSISELRMLLGK